VSTADRETERSKEKIFQHQQKAQTESVSNKENPNEVRHNKQKKLENESEVGVAILSIQCNF
jgi:hypothetical protein